MRWSAQTLCGLPGPGMCILIWMWMWMWGYGNSSARSWQSKLQKPCPQCSPASSPQTTPRPSSDALALRHRRTIAAMATADERELQINPIVASSVQHNTQVRLSTSTPTTPTLRLRLRPPRAPPLPSPPLPSPLPTICSRPRLARFARASGSAY